MDASSLSWTTGGDVPWDAQTTNTHDGVDAAQSGNIQSNQISWIETEVVGPATIHFWTATQFDASGSFGFVWEFTINERRSGVYLMSSFWTEQVHDLPAGTNVLRWTGFCHHGNSGSVCLDGFAVSEPRPLAIDYGPADVTAFMGEFAGISVSASGTPPFRFQWRRDGTNIVHATNSFLYFPAATTNDSGTYSVLVTNSQGWIVSSNASVTILPPVPPFFTFEPESAIAYTGQSFTGWGGVGGSPPFWFQWRKAGSDLPGGIGEWLNLTNVSPAHAGSYSLFVTNAFGSVESSNVSLTVITSVAPVITCQPRSVEAAEGVNTHFTLEAAGLPDPWVRWTKVGTTSSPNPGVPFPQTAGASRTRRFDNVSTNDSGVYFATAGNYGGEVGSREVLLTVLPPIASIGTWNQDAEDVVVANGLAYLARGTNGLSIVSVTDPASPHLVGSFATAGYASKLTVCDGLAFVAEGILGFEIISVADPSAPFLLGGCNTAGYASDIAVRGNFAYVADGSAGLQIFDISNREVPVLAGGFSTNIQPRHICLSGDIAYLTSIAAIVPIGSNSSPGGLLIVNVSDPTHPYETGRLETSVFAIAAQQDFLIADTSIISVTNPAQPASIGYLSYQTPNFPRLLRISAVQIVNGLVYLVDSDGSTMELIVFDVREPELPVPVGYYRGDGYCSAISVDGNRVYVVGYDTPMRIIQTPFNLNSAPAPELWLFGQDGMKLILRGRRGLHYALEVADDLNSPEWQSSATMLLTNDTRVLDVPEGPPQRFFKARWVD